jgi:adenosylcobinamide-GDP ribazoletransferase
MKSEGAAFLLAVQFLTRLPVPTANIYTPERMAASVRYYPSVGVLIGGLCAVSFLLSDLVFPTVIAVLTAIAFGLLMTGAFHEDGLADTFDGIGGGLSREKALLIMRDSRLGTYGTLALIIALGLKALALSALTPALICIGFIFAHGVSRLSSVLVIATSTYVREEGTGKPVSEGVSTLSVIVACLPVCMVFVAASMMHPPSALVSAIGGALLGHVLMRLFFEPKLGGYTGDTLGAVQQASEIRVYLGLLAWL